VNRQEVRKLLGAVVVRGKLVIVSFAVEKV